MANLIENVQIKSKTSYGTCKSRTFIPRDDASEDFAMAKLKDLAPNEVFAQVATMEQPYNETLSECNICIPLPEPVAVEGTLPVMDTKTVGEETVEQKSLGAKRALQKYGRELESILLEVEKGLDPNMSISAMSIMSKRSRATLYREFGGTLPMPIKVGNSSFQKYSTVQAYISGELNAPLEQPVTLETKTKRMNEIQ